MEVPGAAPATDAAAPQSFAEAISRSSTGQRPANDVLQGLALFVLGVVAGAAVTLAVLRDRLPELTSLFHG